MKCETEMEPEAEAQAQATATAEPITYFNPSRLVAHLCRKGQFSHNERMQDE